MTLHLDHLAICAESLTDGVTHVENLLGVELAPGGEHRQMGTHNRLLSLGPALYLEVIAIDPDATPPNRPRWFDLDNFSGLPRLTNWIVRTDDMSTALAGAPDGVGEIMELKRGDLSWQMAVPENGYLPFDGAYPAMIHWHGTGHPAARLPDHGFRLESLEIAHPEAKAVRDRLAPQLNLSNIRFNIAPAKALTAQLCGPNGQVILL